MLLDTQQCTQIGIAMTHKAFVKPEKMLNIFRVDVLLSILLSISLSDV